MQELNPHDSYQLLLTVFRQIEMRNPARRHHTWVEHSDDDDDDDDEAATASSQSRPLLDRSTSPPPPPPGAAAAAAATAAAAAAAAATSDMPVVPPVVRRASWPSGQPAAAAPSSKQVGLDRKRSKLLAIEAREHGMRSMISKAMQAKDVVDRLSAQGGGRRRRPSEGAGHEPLAVHGGSHEDGEISPDHLRTPDRRSHKAHAHGPVDSHGRCGDGRCAQPRASSTWVNDEDSGGGREGELHCHLTHDHHHRVAEVLTRQLSYAGPRRGSRRGRRRAPRARDQYSCAADS